MGVPGRAVSNLARGALALAASLLVLAPGAGAFAATDADPEPVPAERKPIVLDLEREQLELLTGYGVSMRLGVKADEHETRQFAVVTLRYGIFLSDWLGEAPYKGAFEFLVHVDVLSQVAPDERYAAALGWMFRYDFWTGTRLVPYVDLGSGAVLHDLGRPEEGGHVGFPLEAGVGVQVLATETVAVTLEYRFLHISNAGLYSPNYGVNSSLFGIGASLFF